MKCPYCEKEIDICEYLAGLIKKEPDPKKKKIPSKILGKEAHIGIIDDLGPGPEESLPPLKSCLDMGPENWKDLQQRTNWTRTEIMEKLLSKKDKP